MYSVAYSEPCKTSKRLMANFKSSHERCSIKKGVLSSKFTGKHLCQSLFLNKVAGLRLPATLLKKRLQHNCLPVNFAKFPRTPFLQDISGRLLLQFPNKFLKFNNISPSLRLVYAQIYDNLPLLSHICCVKSVQIQNFFWSVFPKKTPYLGTFHALIDYSMPPLVCPKTCPTLPEKIL